MLALFNKNGFNASLASGADKSCYALRGFKRWALESLKDCFACYDNGLTDGAQFYWHGCAAAVVARVTSTTTFLALVLGVGVEDWLALHAPLLVVVYVDTQ